ncbi:MAG TPA: calcium-binding protein [Solirubrobacteraceae bacterium]|nr:calcium-binding protein [Solirubrobacteraceae bacterium]
MLRLLLAAAAAALLAPPAPAAEPSGPSPADAWSQWRSEPRAGAATYEPGAPPDLCEGSFFADQIGTDAGDVLQAARRPERLWGRGGPDALLGSDSRAACLMGGADADVLDVAGGGGAAWGERGADLLLGGPLDDVLDGGAGGDTLSAGAGGDALTGGAGTDALDGGVGDDLIDTADERGEVVQCGAGEDTVVGDRLDVLIGCEVRDLSGRAPLRLVPRPRAAGREAIVRLRFRVPRAGGGRAYRVLMVTGPPAGGPPCAAGPRVLTALPVAGERVRAGQLVKVGLRPPEGGWCAGRVKAVVLRYPACPARRLCVAPPPPEPVARVEFSAG